ncbi:hypothetical protein ABU178_03540 [Pantoea osteomyelitidis]|uniref:Uncharacterized protein n=1 Tax=Pantoea osteomyelitidis TaxID=3230026 RepID=A0ABW7PTM0_9GAMM
MWRLNGVEKGADGYVFDDIETRPETARLSSQCGFASTEEGQRADGRTAAGQERTGEGDR